MSSVVHRVVNHIPSNEHFIVAFASLDGDRVDQHFGSSQGFFVYEVKPDGAELLVSTQFQREAKDGNEDKLKPKLQWLVGSDVVYCGSIGGSATKQLLSLGITPIQVAGGPDIDDLLQSLQAQLVGNAEFWLKNIVRKKRKLVEGFHFDSSEEELWD